MFVGVLLENMPRRCVFHSPHFPVHIDSESTSETSEDVRELVSNAITAAVNSVLFDKIERQLVDIATTLESLFETSNARVEALTPVCSNGVTDSLRVHPELEDESVFRPGADGVGCASDATCSLPMNVCVSLIKSRFSSHTTHNTHNTHTALSRHTHSSKRGCRALTWSRR